MSEESNRWETLSPEEKKKELFLDRHAITQSQYDKSLGDLRDKMGMYGVE